MPFGYIPEEECKRRLDRKDAEHNRTMARINEEHRKEIDGLRDAIHKSGMIKARGRMPNDIDDRYRIQVEADAKILHQMVHGNQKQMVRLLSEQFSHEAMLMLMALSGLERIPVVPLTAVGYPERWYELGEDVDGRRR